MDYHLHRNWSRRPLVAMWLIASVALCAACVRHSAAPLEVREGAYGISSTTLANGMDVIVIENHALPLATVEIAVKNGAYTEPPEFDGLSHLYEHMFFKGNAVIPNQEAYSRRMREMGAAHNGTTSDELVNYYLTVHKENVREAAAFMRDALRYPLFKEEELRREWPVVLGEFDRNEANPGFHLRREVNRRLWWKYLSRKNAIGDREVIFNATRAQMREIQRRYYVPNNSALIVGGDVRPDEIFEMARELFGDWKRSADPHEQWPVPKHPPIQATERIVVLGEGRTAQIQIAWQGPSMKDDRDATFAADVLSFILAQPDSNFHKALVDTGLVDGVGLSYLSLVHTGPITLRAATSADRLDSAWAAIEAELEQFDDPDYITDEQIDTAKNMLEIGEIYGRERTSGFCHTISFWWSTGGLDYYLDYIDNLRRVDRDDIARYVRTYIKGQKRIEAVLLNESQLDQIEFAAGLEAIRPKSGSSDVAFEPQSGGAEVTTEEFDVDGLAVVLRRNPSSEIVVAQMVFIGGLPFYKPENAGQERLLLELLDKGSGSYSKQEVDRQMARTGGSISIATRHDYSTIGIQCLRRDLEANFPIFADAIVHPLLDEEQVKLAVERRLNSIRRQEQIPDAFIPVLASRNFYRGHPYESPPSGVEAVVRSIDNVALRKRHEETFVRARMKLFLIGDVDRATVTRLVRDGLGDLPLGSFERQRRMRDTSQPPRLLVEERDIPTNYIFGCFDAPNFSNPDFPAFQIALSVLSDRFFEEVRTKRNLSYASYAQISSRLSNYGVLYVTAVKPNETIQVMFDEIDRLTAEPISTEVLGDKIQQMITGDLMGNQTARSQCLRMILYDVNGPGWEAAGEIIEKMKAVSPAEVQEVAGRYLKNFSFAVLGSADQIDEELFTSR